MPVSGNEETGLKPVSRMSSSYSAGVPIKKRRFPIIRPPSPTPEEQSSVPVGNESVQKEDSSQSQGSALTSVTIPASSSALSDANKDAVHEKVEGTTDGTNVELVHSSASSFRVKIEEPSPTTMHPTSRSDIGCNEKLVSADNIAKTELNLLPSGAPALSIGKDVSSKKIAKPELNLSPSGTPALNRGKDISCEQDLEGNSDSELSKTYGITELSLGINEHLFSSMAGKNGEGSCQNKVEGKPVSLNLSSSKGESSNQYKSNAFELNTGGANMCTNRSNWDLNTTMDAWNGPMVDQVSGQVAVDGFNTNTGTRDIKPLISSIGTVGGSIASGKQILEGNESRSNAAKFPDPSSRPDLTSSCCNSEDSLNLGLSPSSRLSNLNSKPSSSSALLSSGGNIANLSLRKAFVLTGNLDKVNIKTVKSEPLDESTKHDFKGATVIPKKQLDLRAVKSELVERSNPEALKSSTFSTLKLVDPRAIIPEPVHEGIQETLEKIEGTSNYSGKMMLSGQNIIGKTSSSADLSISGDASNSFECPLNNKRSQFSEEVPQDKAESARLLATDTMSASVGHVNYVANVSGMVDTTIAEDKNVDDPEQHRLKFLDADPILPDSMGNDEGSASDDEKINLSGGMLDEDSYGTDYESDGNHDLGTALDIEQDGIREEDFEDGEVREPLADTTMEEPICEKREAEPFIRGDSDKEQMCFVGVPSDDHPTSSYVENKDSNMEEPSEYNDVNKFSDAACDEKTIEGADDKDAILRDSQAVDMPTNGAANCPKSEETGQSSDQAPGASLGNSISFVQRLDEDVKNTDVTDKNISALPKVETSINVDDVSKDANSGCQKSRIINLRASISSSPGKTGTFSSRSMPTRAGRVPYVAVDGEKLCPGGRDEIYTGGSHKFSRDRHQDQSSRNSRLNFVRSRGRISSRINAHRGDWDSERNFAPELYSGPAEFRVPRHKYASQTDLEFNNYNVGLSGAFAGTGRGGRKPLNDEAPVFCPLPSRRQSPGLRNGPPGRSFDVNMVHRIPRNISPSRCIGEGGSELVGLRHGEEFMRDLPNDNSNPMYTHAQDSYVGLGRQFVQGNRDFLSVQRRGISGICSKSPTDSRTRASGTWSPRRRSPDGFGGHSELPNQRPPLFRMERMRSPDHSCFPPEMVARRHGSPYMSRQSNELREVDSGRDLGHPRTVIPNRSPSGRVLLRNTRRLDDMDNDDFFGRPMHSARYQEPGVDGTNERRRFSERRGPVRPFRPPFNGAEVENFHLNAENGPRPFRFRPEDDSDFHNRRNLREREFDRRIKNPLGSAPRRTRNMEEQEGNFRHPGQVWRDEGFDDMSRIKRKRF